MMARLCDNRIKMYKTGFKFTGLLLVPAILAGCASGARPLMPTPNLYIGKDAPELFIDLPAELQNEKMDLLYVTDRVPETDEAGGLTYGYGRSRSAAFGSAVVTTEPGMGWEELQRVSLESTRSTKLSLQLASITELGRFEATPIPYVLIDGKPQPDPSALEKSRITEQSFHSEVRRRLALAPKPEIVLFVHGYNNEFGSAAQTLAEIWHFLGREHVPLLYTWPAGRGGPSGYMYDRESGEFTIYHLKNLLRSLASIPEIKKIHMIAHSRGTDVLGSAFRELALVGKATGVNALADLQGSHLILAAPDLDMDVVSQRILAEQLGRGSQNITVYTSQGDKAIGIAERLFKSAARIGRLGVEDLQAQGVDSMDKTEGLSFIDLQENTGGTGHGYFHSSPAASSDLILLIRYGFEPGAENGRPLESVAPGFWQIQPEYPYFQDDKAE
jgi:esterase/lipase superfamily enzyme